MTVTNPDEAIEAHAAGADALVVQGFEAGGHRGYFEDSPEAEDLGLLVALRLVAHRVDLPLIAAGGLVDDASVAAVLCAGAIAAQVGTAPIRAAAREAEDPHAINLWAGQAYALVREAPAADVVRRLGAEARAVARELAGKLGQAG